MGGKIQNTNYNNFFNTFFREDICLEPFIFQIFPTRYLRCSKHVPVRVLKKLVQMKFEVKKTHKVVLSCGTFFKYIFTCKSENHLFPTSSQSFAEV